MMWGAPVRWLGRAYRGQTKADIGHIVMMFGVCVTLYGISMFVIVPWLLAISPLGCGITFAGLEIQRRWADIHKPRRPAGGPVCQAAAVPNLDAAEVKVTGTGQPEPTMRGKRLPFQIGIASFLGAPVKPRQSSSVTWLSGQPQVSRPSPAMAFLGLPYDNATTYRSGARMGPAAIRAASLMLTDGDHPEYGVNPADAIIDWGDAEIPYVALPDAQRCVEAAVSDLLAHHQHPLIAGGDHSITLGVLRAIHKARGQKLALLHFDAHCDTWPDHFGDKQGHGTWVRDAVEEGLVEPTQVWQIGIRSPVDATTAQWLPSRGGCVMSARKIMDPFVIATAPEWSAEVFETSAPVYISFDIDCLDPAHAPGTGTPEIGGLSTIAALKILECFVENYAARLVGMDVVEVAPVYDHSEITALAAASLLWTYASALMHAESLPQTP